MRRDQVLLPRPGMANANSDAAEFRAEVRVDRAQAVVAREPAADPHLDLHRRQVELIVEDGEGVEVELVKTQRLTDRVAAVVHEGLGL
jgi:hypothetical protein